LRFRMTSSDDHFKEALNYCLAHFYTNSILPDTYVFTSGDHRPHRTLSIMADMFKLSASLKGHEDDVSEWHGETKLPKR
jgi:hypothetical protein